MTAARTLLHIDASARTQGALSRDLSARVAARLADSETHLIRRDLAAGLPVIDAAWVAATSLPPADRTTDQRAALGLSDELVAEVQVADTLVIGTPVYNFSVPAALKAWIDLVARAGVTFRYTPDGPRGLLTGKRAVVAVATGGTPVGSDIDFATGYLRHVLGFLGIADVRIVAAERVMADRDAALARAEAQLAALTRAA
jgi:FMN-dependent NADH-azoreductase